VTFLEEMQRVQLIAYFAEHHDIIMNHHFKILIIVTSLVITAAFIITADKSSKETPNLSSITTTYNY